MLRVLFATAISFVLSLLPVETITFPAGAYFDALMEMREPIPVAHELLLVESAASSRLGSRELAPPTEAIWAVAELGAERVLLPPSWLGAAGSELSTADAASRLSARLEEEFALIDENVAELFEAIRIGSIKPEEADRFVAQLRRLIGKSQESIQEELRHQSDGSAVSVADMLRAFGSDRLGTELSSLGLSLPDYSSAAPVPVAPEDDQGNLAFRSLPYASLNRYVSLADRLRARLSVLEEAGVFDQTDPQNRPSIMVDRILSLREELYEAPSEDRAAAWREAADQYYETVARLIDEETEARLLDRLGSLEEEEDLKEESAAQIRELRGELSDTFAAVRSEYASVATLRSELAGIVGGSFVIIGDGEATEENPARSVGWPFPTKPTEAEVRAVVANSLLVEKHLLAPTNWYRTLLLTAAGLLVAMLLSLFSPPRAAALSPAVVLLVAGIFPVLFLLADIWVNPIAVLSVLAGATIASALTALFSQWSVERVLTGRAADRLPPRLLRQTLRRGALQKNGGRQRQAAVVVVAPQLSPDAAGLSKQRHSVEELALFHKEISKRIRRLDGIVIGEEGTNVLAAFTAPAQRSVIRDNQRDAADRRLAQDACGAVRELLSASLPGGVRVRCGVDLGELTFYLSPIGGYRAAGPAMTYARRLCSLARKHRRRVLFGEGAVAACREGGEEAGFREEGRLVLPGDKGRYVFFSLTERDPPTP